MKKLFNISTVAGILAFLMCVSCSPMFYGPASQNVTLFEKKGESRISAGYGQDNYTKGVILSAAHALTDHAAVSLSFTHRSFSDPISVSD